MKKMMYLGLITLGVIISGTVSAQTETKKEIKKEVKVEEVNGEKVLTIKKTQDGKVVSEEVHRGEEAERRIERMEKREDMRKSKGERPVKPKHNLDHKPIHHQEHEQKEKPKKP